MANQNPVGKTYKPTEFMRHPLTGRNQEELGIPAKAGSLLQWEGKTWRQGFKVTDYVQAKAQRKTEDGQDRWITPTGFSLNKRRYGAFPSEEETAHQRGWYAYMNMGVPLIEERSDIEQPPPDVISQQTYVNRTDPQEARWTNTVEFSISNTISWSLQGQVQLTFGVRSIAELQQQLQQSLAMKSSQKSTTLNSKDRQGSDSETLTETTSTTTATGHAKGVGELWATLMLGITASVSGSLTTSWKQTTSLSGTIGSRVVVRATQRRQVKRFDYEFPITFGGYVALYYPEPVEFSSVRTDVTDMDLYERTRVQNRDPKMMTVRQEYTQVIVHPVDIIGLIEDGEKFTQKGAAEVVSTLAGEHEVFEIEKLQHGNRDFDGIAAPLYKPKP
jgi:hypothetical protein